MSDDVTAQTAGAEEFMAATRVLINELVWDVMDPAADGLSDGDKVYTLTSSIPDGVRLDDVKVYFAAAVLMLAEERSR
jgi:hypothetical protein